MLRPRGLTQELVNKLLDQYEGSDEEWLDFKSHLEAERLAEDGMLGYSDLDD